MKPFVISVNLLLIIGLMGCASTPQAKSTQKAAIGGGFVAAGATVVAVSGVNIGYTFSQTPEIVRDQVIASSAPLVITYIVLGAGMSLGGLALLSSAGSELEQAEIKENKEAEDLSYSVARTKRAIARDKNSKTGKDEARSVDRKEKENNYKGHIKSGLAEEDEDQE